MSINVKIKEINPQAIKLIRNEMKAALKPLGEKYGIEITPKHASYTKSNFTIKVEVAVLNAEGKAETKAVSDYKEQAVLFGLDPDWLGKEFKSRGKTYTISGLKPRSSKFPVLADDEKGDTFKFKAEDIKRKFKPSPATPTI